jgi:hypothetical protein
MYEDLGGVAGCPRSGVVRICTRLCRPFGPSYDLRCASISPNGFIRRAKSTAGGFAPCQADIMRSKLSQFMAVWGVHKKFIILCKIIYGRIKCAVQSPRRFVSQLEC